MTHRQRQWLARLVLTAATVAGLAFLAGRDLPRRISTDVLDLVPADERSPELALVRQLASQAEGRTMLIALERADGTPADDDSARSFAEILRESSAFAAATAQADAIAPEAAGRALFGHRFELLFPRWLDDRRAIHAAESPGEPFPIWLAARGAQELESFLSSPEALAWQDLLEADPLLLLPDAVARLGQRALERPATDGLVWAQLAGSPLREEYQGPAFAAIEEARRSLLQSRGPLVVRYTGVNRFAAASRARIVQEVGWLNTASLIGVLAVAFLFIRQVHRGLHLVPVMALALLGAWVGTMLAFDRVHIMVFVVGSLLTGVAIDYGFYLFLQPPAAPGEVYWLKVRRLLPPLLASCLTTVAGFALLLFSELPLIRQLGVFVGTGLVAALAAAILYFSTLRDPYLPTRALFPGGLPWSGGRPGRVILLLLWLGMVAGLTRLSWRDDIRELEVASPGLRAEDQALRARFGQTSGRSVFLSHGATPAAARDALEEFEAWLRASTEPKLGWSNLGEVIPRQAALDRAHAFAAGEPGFPAAFRAALAQRGFAPDGFDPFFTAYHGFAASPAPQLDTLVPALLGQAGGPLGLMANATGPRSWFVTVVDGTVPPPPPRLQTMGVNQLQSLNRLFATYRAGALRLSLAGLALVGLGVFAMYGWRDGLRIFLIPCGTCLGVFGLFGWLQVPLNLFHVLGAFLGVCLTHNYSIFTATSAYRREATPVSVRLSALTTAASFGVLALSDIPVVRALGVTVLAMVLAALLLIEGEHLAGLGGRK